MHNIPEPRLAVRENKSQERRIARQRMLEATWAGQHIDLADLARLRGAVVRERNDSIFSDAWIFVSLVALIVGYFANRNPALLALGAVLLLIAGVSRVWRNFALVGVTYRRHFDRTHVFPGEPIVMTIIVTNDKPLPLTWLRFQDELPVSPETENIISQIATEIAGRYYLTNSFWMQPHDQSQRQVTLQFPKRGFYKLGPVNYKSGDIFTLFTIERTHHSIDSIVIYPQIYPLEALGLPAKEPFGEIKVNRSLFTDPIRTQGIRDYQPQDRFRDIHWKATARRGYLQTKVYDPSTGMTLAVFLNVATYERHWMGFNPELMENAVSVAASVANYGFQQSWGVGVYANGAVPNSDQPIRVQPGRSPDQLTFILEALAAVTEFATSTIDVLMLRESPNLPWVATIVLVTAVVTEEIMVALLRLKEAGRRVVLISLAAEAPPGELGSILTYHVPATAPVFQHEDGLNEEATVAALNDVPGAALVTLSVDRVNSRRDG